MVALVGETLFIANVGDSTGILCSTLPVFEKAGVQYIVDAAATEAPFGTDVATGAAANSSSQEASESAPGREEEGSSEGGAGEWSNTLVITAEHSPESAHEYRRLRRHRSRVGDPSLPALVVVYDSNSHDKNRCSPVFAADEAGRLVVTNKGR